MRREGGRGERKRGVEGRLTIFISLFTGGEGKLGRGSYTKIINKEKNRAEE